MEFTRLPRPAIIAHRGASLYSPENTIAAFELAVQQGADAIELDAKLCGSGEIVVIHDQTVDRTTTGKGYVNRLSLPELKRLDAGSFFDVAYRGEKIPTLEEVFEAVGRKTFINVELTNYASPLDDLPLKAVALVKKLDMSERVFFSSFNILSLLRARRILPQVPACLLSPAGFARSWLYRFTNLLFRFTALHPEHSDLTQTLVQYASRRHQRIHAWTVNSSEEIHRLILLNVDGIITDDPLTARQVLTSIRQEL